MALQQLYWVPRGAPPDRGAYVAYPFADLLGIVALESLRNRCAVIGEDLGTVPPGFSRTLNDCNILSYRLLMFEQEDDGRFLPPKKYPRAAAAAFSSHDLPTVRGFWLGTDIAWRRRLELYPDAATAARDEERRRRDRRDLLAALIAEGLIDADAARRFLPRDDAPVFADELAVAIYRFLGRTNSALALLEIADVAGEAEQAERSRHGRRASELAAQARPHPRRARPRRRFRPPRRRIGSRAKRVIHPGGHPVSHCARFPPVCFLPEPWPRPMWRGFFCGRGSARIAP